jgi:hypothetical protein
MKAIGSVCAIATALFVACLAGSALAQANGGTGRIYNPKTEIAVTGTIEKIENVASPRSWPGIHLTVRTGNQEYDVHVGPSAYVAGKGLTFSVGDQLEIAGSKVKLGGEDALIAREIKSGDKTLQLRDSMGVPYWSRGRRHTN